MDAQDLEGMRPLHIAAINAQVAAAAALLENRADPLAVDSTGDPLAGTMHRPESKQSGNGSEENIDAPAPEHEGFTGRRAIFYAFRAGCPGLVEILRRASSAAAAKLAVFSAGSGSGASTVPDSKVVDPRDDDPSMQGLDD